MKKTMLYARSIWLALCFGTPAVLLFAFNVQVLQGHPASFLTGFASIPWRNPLVLGMLTLSVATLIALALLPERLSNLDRFKASPIFSRLLIRHVLTCGLLESIAIYGFLLGFVLDATLASLSLVLMLVPMGVGCIIFPNEHDWRYRFSLEQEPS